MPLHSASVMSRHGLDHPDEKPPVKAPSFDTVLKYNPNHDKAGRFTSGKGGGGKPSAPTGYSTSSGYSTQHQMDGGFYKGQGRALDPHFDRGDSSGPSIDPGFHRGAPVTPGYSAPNTRGQAYAKSQEAQYLAAHTATRPHMDISGVGGAFDPSNTKTHPMGTEYGSDEFLVPSNESVDAATRNRYRDQRSHPLGTIYGSSSTLIPIGTGGKYPQPGTVDYFHLTTGKKYRAFPDSVIPRIR